MTDKKMKSKLNLGCGNDYKEGWLNVDFNEEVKADVYLNLNKTLPWEDNTFSEVLLDNTLEHIRKDDIFSFFEELCRVCKKDAIINIFVPHFSGMYNSKHLGHYNQFGINSFSIFVKEDCYTSERLSKARFEIMEERIMFWHHNLHEQRWLSRLPGNWFWNINKSWQLLMERFMFLGFDEIEFKLKVIK